jgi:hypothetical protein
MSERETDIVDELRALCLASIGITPRPEGPNDEELTRLGQDARWRAADEIERQRHAASLAWQPMNTAPKDAMPVLLFCPHLKGHACREIVVGVWRFDPNRRTFGYWESDVGALDNGFAETGPWIEYSELHPERWSPLPAPPDLK